jgi:4-carboxymuconolactone decarboxylase
MTRLPGLTFDQLDDDQRRLWESITSGRRGSAATLTDSSGALVGPFNAMLYSPNVGARISALGEALRFDTSLDRRLIELATITVAARWQSDFEWAAHSRMAARAGIDASVIDAIGRGDPPPLSDDVDVAVHRLARELLDDGQISDATYANATGALGEHAVVELVGLIGYYCLISFVLNAFRVPPPPGQTPPWG